MRLPGVRRHVLSVATAKEGWIDALIVRLGTYRVVDTDEVLRLERRVFRAQHYRSAMSLQIAADSRLATAHHSGRLVGFALAIPVGEESSGWWYLDTVAVHPTVQRRRVGRAVTLQLCDWLRLDGATWIDAVPLAGEGEAGRRAFLSAVGLPWRAPGIAVGC